MNFLYLILFGYLVGSFSPGYFFGRTVKGIDIRKYGRRNTGATNTFYTVGKTYGVIAGFIDALKAIFVYLVSVNGLKLLNFEALSPDLAIFSGLAAVFGHVYPFYLNFKGGMGVASLIGLNFIVLFFTRSFFALGLFIAMVIYFLVMTERPGVREALREAPLRKVLKLAGLALPLAYLVFSQAWIFRITGALLLVSASFDFLRFVWPGLNKKYLNLRTLAKNKEAKTLSGYTLFLLSALILFTFFPKEAAVAGIVFFILGDTFAPLIRKWFWPKVIMGDKTYGGAGLFFVLSFVSGVFLNSLTDLSLSLKFITAGGLAAVVFDLMSVWIDDNLLVPLGTAVVLTFLV
ncbi:MAG: glycerol-3-phosphate acyltransferase [Parcubacteria group bacterium]|nr:glycerol-3-phosphate acyltransferase [Parcubacteria group bacterium]